jgi:nucleotide-binding universal stress UspA family protein
MDLRTLFDPTLMLFTLAVIGVASIGKFLGALAGGRLGGLTGAESLALATGLNARGSTEVIIASIGLSMGVLSNQLYTMIVAMAVVTTMIMPPTLRWVLARVPLREEEARRLEKEEAEEGESVPQMERALVCVDDSANGRLAASLAGMFAARQQILTTVMEIGASQGRAADPGREILAQAAMLVLEKIPAASDGEAASAPQMSLQELVHAKSADTDDAVEKEAAKGYSIAFVGIEHPMSATANRFEEQLQRLVEAFDGPLAIALNGTRSAAKLGDPLKLLVPTGGTPDARLATEIALVLAKASGGILTALHVFDPQDDAELLRGRARRQGLSVLVDARRLGKRSGVPVKGITVTHSRPEAAALRVARAGRYDLVVVGTSLRQGEARFLGPRSAALLRALRSPVLLVAR